MFQIFVLWSVIAGVISMLVYSRLKTMLIHSWPGDKAHDLWFLSLS